MKKIPALLDNPPQANMTSIKIQVSSGEVSMTFTDAKMAQAEYQHIRSQGIYAGQWIKSIELIQIKND